MVLTTDTFTASRTARQLHWHTAFTDSERMSVDASISVSGASEFFSHCGNHHAHLAAGNAVVEHTSDFSKLVR
ncbi:hypothetical protein KC340_g77 [Hortaea werneckii]|nr:hypothetical protein KC340_g77 [Hortaea werneckii]